MFSKKTSMWLRAVSSSLVVLMAGWKHETLYFVMGIGLLMSACLLALSVVLNEPE